MIDTHTHIFSEEFDGDIDSVVARATQSGVKMLLLPNIDISTLDRLRQTVKRFPTICKPMLGLHPTSVTDNYVDDVKRILDCVPDFTPIAIGEIGVDLYWDQSYRHQQMEAFSMQVDYATAHALPIAVHCRNAFDETFEVLDNFASQNLSGVMHCFSGTMQQAEYILEHYPNMMFGVNGVVTYKKSDLPQIIKNLSHNKILIETDAPYLSPMPFRGKRNEPSYVKYVLEKLAEIFDISETEMETITDRNAQKLFNI